MGNKIFTFKKCQKETEINQEFDEREVSYTKHYSMQEMQNTAAHDLPENQTLMLPYNLVDNCNLAHKSYEGLSYEETMKLNKSEKQKSVASVQKKNICRCFKRKRHDCWEYDSDCSDEWAQEDFLTCRARQMGHQRPRLSEDLTLPSSSQEVTLAAESSSAMPLDTDTMATFNNSLTLGRGDAKAALVSEGDITNTIGSSKSKFKLSQEQTQNNTDSLTEIKRVKRVHWKPEIDIIYFGTGSEVFRTTSRLKH